jgi:ATP-dependent Lhr-like helicase
LDTTLLAELLGRIELRELLDPDVVTATGRQLQHLTAERAARDAEGVADLLRLLGPLTEAEITERSGGAEVAGWLEGLHGSRRALPVSFAGRSWWVAAEDIARLRDGVGAAVPIGVPLSLLEPVSDPLRELLGRFARTHGPFTTAAAAERFGLGLSVTADVLGRLAGDGALVRGEFTDTPTALPGGEQWCDTEVLRILRRRSLAALRSQIEPVSTAGYARFLPSWQQVGSSGVAGVDGLASVIDQLAGAPMPASAVESLVFSQRVHDYQPAMLDELLATGEVIWSGAGALSAGDGWVTFHPADTAPQTLTPPAELDLTDAHRAILDALSGGGAFFFRQLAGDIARAELKEALWQLIWSGRVTGDTFAPVRAMLNGTRRPGARHTRAPRLSRYHIAAAAGPAAERSDPAVAGRWSLLPEAETDSTVRAHFQAELLLGRYGVLTKGAATVEHVPGGFALLYKVLSALQDAGRCQRGYFVESLGGAQFATAATVDRLRTFADTVDGAPATPGAVALAATDPANPYGAALPWPVPIGDADPGHRPGRKAGALVILVDGALVWFVERGGRSLLNFADDPAAHAAAATALAGLVADRRVEGLLVQRISGVAVLDPAATGSHRHVVEALSAAGFSRTPRGLRLR